MPNAYIVSQRPFNYGGALSLLVEMLVSAGWTYQASGAGAGTGFSPTGKIFTTTGSGVNGWSNASAWARVQDPGAVRELVFQHNNTGGVRVKYSANAKFTGGTPSATQVPSATDERVLWGAGTDASPTPGAWFNTSTVTVAPYGGPVVGASTVAGSVVYMGGALSTAPYGFWFASQFQDGSTKAKGASMLYDPVVSVPEDTDPYVITMATTNSFLGNTSAHWGRDGATPSNWTTTQTGVIEGSFAHMDTGRTQFLYVQPAGYVSVASGTQISLVSASVWSAVVASAAMNANPFSGKQEGLPVAYMRSNAAASIPGLKGWSTLMRWCTTLRGTFVDTLDNKAWICVGNVWLPWDGVSQPLG